MKWLLVILILGNAAFFTWTSLQQDVIAPRVAPVYQAPISVPIQLVSELSAAELAQLDLDSSTSNTTSTEKAPANVLEALDQVLGDGDAKQASLLCPWFETEKKADQKIATQVLDQLGVSYANKEVTGARPKYWLYIAAPDTQTRAQAIVKELAGKSIDSFIISRGEMKNRISLGLFSSQARADQAKLRIEKATGYAVDVFQHQRSVTLQQTNIERPISEQMWGQFISALDLSKIMIKLEKNPC
ncbi:SPOR domain-containing protein [Marinomonas epiphytica]